MKLLLDCNLSPRLTELIADLFPGSAHVFDFGLGPDDLAIWEYAVANSFTIVSKDSDFYRLSVVHGAPPKVVWLRVGNAATADVAALLRRRVNTLDEFAVDADSALLILGQ